MAPRPWRSRHKLRTEGWRHPGELTELRGGDANRRLELSARREKPFVAVDCGAIPDTLIESELFGYEKGAFTGAHQRKDGQFQLAAGGSLFLDEIVNLPLPTQAKLLRALQERQVQPLGSKQPVRVAARIIAVSNVPLGREVRAGRFARMSTTV